MFVTCLICFPHAPCLLSAWHLLYLVVSHVSNHHGCISFLCSMRSFCLIFVFNKKRCDFLPNKYCLFLLWSSVYLNVIHESSVYFSLALFFISQHYRDSQSIVLIQCMWGILISTNYDQVIDMRHIRISLLISAEDSRASMMIPDDGVVISLVLWSSQFPFLSEVPDSHAQPKLVWNLIGVVHINR